MAKKNLKPVKVAGIEFDALIEQTKTLNSEIPVYPVESGYEVSDTIQIQPMELSLKLFLTATPGTFLKKHGMSKSRPEKVTKQLEDKYNKKKLIKVVTSQAIYTSMGITSISWTRSKDSRYSREIDMTLKKVIKTKTKTGSIKSSSRKSGKSKAKGGKASTRKASKRQKQKAKRKVKVRKK